MSRNVWVAALCVACLFMGSSEVFATVDGVPTPLTPSMTFEGSMYGRTVKIDRSPFCGLPPLGGPYHYLSNLDVDGIPRPATCSDVQNIPELPPLGGVIGGGGDYDYITLNLPVMELMCLRPYPGVPDTDEARLYAGSEAELVVDLAGPGGAGPEVIAAFSPIWMDMDIHCLGPGVAEIVAKARGTIEPRTFLGEELLQRLMDFGGTDQAVGDLTVTGFFVQGIVGIYEYELTVYPAMHREILEVMPAVVGAPMVFWDANALLSFAALTRGGDLTMSGNFTNTLDAVAVRHVDLDPGPPPAGIAEVIPAHWRVCTLLLDYTADLGFPLPLAQRPEDLRILRRPDGLAPWEIYPPAQTGVVVDRIVAGGVEALSDWTIGSTTPNNFVPLGFIAGQVLDDLANPIDSAFVHAWSESQGAGYNTFSGPDGSYVIPGLPADDYVVNATAAGFVPQFYDGVTDPTQVTLVAVTPPDTSKNVDFMLLPIQGPLLDVCIPEEIVGAPGDTVPVPVKFCGPVAPAAQVVGDPSIISAQMTILFDGGLLNLTGCHLVDTVTDATWEIEWLTVPGVPGTPDSAKIAMAGVTPIFGPGVIVWLVFAVAPEASVDQCTDLVFQRFMFNEGAPGANTDDGSLCVGAPALVGDVSLNGAVTAFDGAVILRFRVGLTGPVEYPGLRPQVADVDRSGEISSLDAVYILQLVVGMIPQLPVPPEFLLFKPVVATRHIWLGAPESSDDGLLVPIYADDLAGILAGELRFSYPGSAIEIVPSEQTTDYLFASHASEGEVRAAFAGATSGSPGMGALGYLRIDVPYGEFDAGALRLEDVLLNDGGMVALVVGRTPLPTKYELSQNRPNPFNPYTSIRYALPASDRVMLSVYNVQGQLVRTLVDAFQNTGVYTVTWDGTDASGRIVASGVYVYRLASSTFRESRKMLLMK